jgi:2-dehydropantoate 2-reductase
VIGTTVMLPADYTVPGEVICHSAPKRGVFELGRYPSGRDATVDALASLLESAEFLAVPMDDVMRSKRGKLLDNLGNVLGVALPAETPRGEVYHRARLEGEAVYRAMGLDWADLRKQRSSLAELAPVPGASRTGGSTLQSVLRGAGSIETDYLNGEIALLGRLHGVPTPVNAGLTTLARRIVREGLPPGGFSVPQLEAELGLA